MQIQLWKHTCSMEYRSMRYHSDPGVRPNYLVLLDYTVLPFSDDNFLADSIITTYRVNSNASF